MTNLVPGRQPRLKTAARGFVFLWFLLGGIAHFAAADVELRIVPPYVPWPTVAVALSGICELLGAAGLLYAPTRRVATIGLFVLTIAVTPANVYMLQHWQSFSIPRWLLVARLPVQVVLLAVIAWITPKRASLKA